jgi:hypothetical protein
MAYAAHYFRGAVQDWIGHGWLSRGQWLIDFGSQEFVADPREVRREAADFLKGNGKAPGTPDGRPRVRDLYAALGINYVSIDVDGNASSFFDLNTFSTPHYWRDAFDFVNNEGTIEHLANPINGFHVAHDMARVGGVIRHSFPLIGWADHGFVNLTTKFYAHLVGDNAYEVLRLLAIVSEPTPLNDPFFTTCYGLADLDENRVQPLPPPTITNIWGELVYRKTSDRPFVVPVDHVEGSNAGTIKRRLNENFGRISWLDGS